VPEVFLSERAAVLPSDISPARLCPPILHWFGGRLVLDLYTEIASNERAEIDEGVLFYDYQSG
jgi:hypothetical protein